MELSRPWNAARLRRSGLRMLLVAGGLVAAGCYGPLGQVRADPRFRIGDDASWSIADLDDCDWQRAPIVAAPSHRGLFWGRFDSVVIDRGATGLRVSAAAAWEASWVAS